MPQFALTNGELLKKTLRTTLVMVGSTALWLGALTGAVVVGTGSVSSATADAKLEKGVGAAATILPRGPTLRGPRGMPGMNPVRRGGLGAPRVGAVHPGDPI
jgi:hypothetical protein